jgi:hypothetical protein
MLPPYFLVHSVEYVWASDVCFSSICYEKGAFVLLYFFC